MFETIITKAISVIITVAIGFAGMFGYVPEQNMGATIPVTVALFETSLSAKITSSATSMTLVSGTDKSGDALNGYFCFILDEGSVSEEFVCGTASSTAISSMIRGIDPIDGDLEVSALKKSHRRGSSVKATNYPQLAIISRILNGDETVPSLLTYAATTTPTSDAHIIHKKYADDLAIAGAPDITYSVKGIAELATTSELIIGTTTGATGAYLVVPNDLFHATTSATTIVPVTGSDGKLSQGFLDLTEAWNISGALTASGVNTLSGTTTISGALTASDNITLSGATTLSGVITQSGTTTFSVIPTLPASDPTADNEAVRKAYADETGIDEVSFGSFTIGHTGSTTAWTTDLSLGFTPKLLIVNALDSAGAAEPAHQSYGTASGTGSANQECIEIQGTTEHIYSDYIYINTTGADDDISGEVTTWGATTTITFTPNATYSHSGESEVVLWIAFK